MHKKICPEIIWIIRKFISGKCKYKIEYELLIDPENDTSTNNLNNWKNTFQYKAYIKNAMDVGLIEFHAYMLCDLKRMVDDLGRSASKFSRTKDNHERTDEK